MKSDFHEDFQSERADPLDAQSMEFDFDALDVGIERADLSDSEHYRLGVAIRAVVEWLIGTNRIKPRSDKLIGRRAIALAWALNPALIEDSPSLSEIARRLKCNKVALSLHSADAHRKFGIRNRGQSHGWNFKPTLVAPDQTESDEEQDEHHD